MRETAELLCEARDATKAPATSDDSIEEEALIQLEALPSTWITVEDIPALLEFLGTPSGESDTGWRRWTDYWDSIDFETRRQSPVTSSYYSARGGQRP